MSKRSRSWLDEHIDDVARWACIGMVTAACVAVAVSVVMAFSIVRYFYEA